jgi:uncharacterized protein with ATP-grasp and redox domains
MNTSLECIPCFLRQTLDAAKMVTADAHIHEQIAREVLRWASEMPLNVPPPVLGQRIHGRLRELIGNQDPFREAKASQNRMALRILYELKKEIDAASDPLDLALRLAIAGNVIDMGVSIAISESAVREAVRHALAEPVHGDYAAFHDALAEAQNILYLADNAGEIAFDRVLIEQLSPGRVTVAVRGAPIVNDATLVDARAIGLHGIVEVIDNGSDAPGTILEECSEDFVKRFVNADLILAKGQGNFETLSELDHNIFFLFKAKCPVIAGRVGVPVGTNVLTRCAKKSSETR